MKSAHRGLTGSGKLGVRTFRTEDQQVQDPKVVAWWVHGTTKKARGLEYSKRQKEGRSGLGKKGSSSCRAL